MLAKNIKILLKKKNQKRKYGRDRHKNLSETEKQGLVEYSNRYYEMRKNKNLLQIKK